VTGSQLTQTDVGWNLALDSTASWRVLTNWTIGCTPTMRTESSINTSRSNIRQGSIAVESGITQLDRNKSVSVYPNPANENVTIDISGAGFLVANLKLYNIIGEMVYQTEITSASTVIPVSSFAKGVYTIVIANKGVNVFKKLVIN
jgi:hypothetical protein